MAYPYNYGYRVALPSKTYEDLMNYSKKYVEATMVFDIIILALLKKRYEAWKFITIFR